MDVIASEAKQSLLFESKRLPRPFGPRNDNSSNYMRQSTRYFFTPLIRHDQRKITFSNPILKTAVKSATTFYLYNPQSSFSFPWCITNPQNHFTAQIRQHILPLKSAFSFPWYTINPPTHSTIYLHQTQATFTQFQFLNSDSLSQTSHFYICT